MAGRSERVDELVLDAIRSYAGGLGGSMPFCRLRGAIDRRPDLASLPGWMEIYRSVESLVAGGVLVADRPTSGPTAYRLAQGYDRPLAEAGSGRDIRITTPAQQPF